MDKLSRLKEIVQKELSSSAHDIDHTYRVLKLARLLAKNENANMEIVEIAAILHDIARVREDKDKSGNTDHAALGAKMAEKILKELNYSEDIVKGVVHCIETHRFRGEKAPKTIEAKILFDADKLDALGAVGVARAYIIAGEMGEPLYREETNIEEYKNKNLTEGKSNGRIKDVSKHSVNIEYEMKFKHLPERLFTEKAKQIAKDRLKFMDQFFERLKKEIEGEA